jgi:DNA-binding transcriptional regulator LsrR (DeoR family)
LSEGIKNKFQIKEVHVVPGDADNSQSVKTELGRQALTHAIVDPPVTATIASSCNMPSSN